MQHCGYVSILGLPNAGKSSLTNALVGAEVSIISKKPQTTQTRITGIFVENETQVVLVDTPGLFAKRSFDKCALNSAKSTNLQVVLVDAHKYLEDKKNIAQLFENLSQDIAFVIVLNKIDLVPNRSLLLPIIEELQLEFPNVHIFLLSALKGDGVDLLKAHIVPLIPTAPWLYPREQISTLPSRFLAAEITREQIMELIHQEVPYFTHVNTLDFEETDSKITIHQEIWVAKDSYKPIIIGAMGNMIKRIGTRARLKLANLLKKPVHLFLKVKVVS